MLYWAAVFFVIALLAAIFGFGGIAAGAAEIGTILFFIFLVVCAVTLILGLINRRSIAPSRWAWKKTWCFWSRQRSFSRRAWSARRGCSAGSLCPVAGASRA